jgi:hypothetical protein
MFYLSGVTNEHCLTSLLLFLNLSNLMIPDDIDVFDCVWAGARIVQQSDKTVEQPIVANSMVADHQVIHLVSHSCQPQINVANVEIWAELGGSNSNSRAISCQVLSVTVWAFHPGIITIKPSPFESPLRLL